MVNQLDLFPSSTLVVDPPKISSNPCDTIIGLKYQENFINDIEERNLLNKVDKNTWLHDLKRRVQHYGYKYDYRVRRIDTSMRLGALPDWLDHIALQLFQDGYFKGKPDQVIVNEYEPGQGISPHIDCEPCFEDTVVSLSLHSTAVMEFSKYDLKVPVLLEPRSIVILKGESRYKWKHTIPARKVDVFEGVSYPRNRRISLTFRKVIL